MFRKLYVLLASLKEVIKTIPALWKVKKMKEESNERKNIIRKSIQECSGRIMTITGSKIHVKGIENIPTNQNVLYVANHSSMFDITLLYSILPNPLVGFVAKMSLKFYPIISGWIKATKGVFLNRGRSKKAMKQAIKTMEKEVNLLKQGHSMVVFADGTRKTEEKDFKSGSLKPAQKTNIPIVPVAITGTEQIFKESVKRPIIHITFLSPRYISRKDNINEVTKEIQNDVYEEKEKHKILIKKDS